MIQVADALSVTLRELVESTEAGRPTLAEVARLFECAPTEVQVSILGMLRSVAAARGRAALTSAPAARPPGRSASGQGRGAGTRRAPR